MRRSIDIVVPGVAALLIVKFANVTYRSPAQSPPQLGTFANLSAVITQGEGFDMCSEVGLISGGVRRRGRGSADEIAIAFLSEGAANFVAFPITLLALFAAVMGCWSSAASAGKSARVGA